MGMGIQGCSGISLILLELELARDQGVPGIFVGSLPGTSSEELGGVEVGGLGSAASSIHSIHPIRMLWYENKKVEVAK